MSCVDSKILTIACAAWPVLSLENLRLPVLFCQAENAILEAAAEGLIYIFLKECRYVKNKYRFSGPDLIQSKYNTLGGATVQQRYRQEKQTQMMQMQMSDKPVIKEDNRIFRVQNPMRSELSLSLFFLFKGHIARSVKKTREAHSQVNIIFGKVGGSWWKPEFRIIVGGKNKKTVQLAMEMLQKKLNGEKEKKEKKAEKK